MTTDPSQPPNQPDGPDSPWADHSEERFGQLAMSTTTYEYVPPGDDRTKVIFAGRCPRCTHEFTFEWPLEVLRGATRESIEVLCQCASDHKGRPEGEKRGCGAYWASEIEP